MFSFLDAVNQYLSYINFSPKLKNRIYTVVGSLADAYLFYVSYKFFVNANPLRGSLFLLVAVLLAYFAVLNFIYFFTNHQAWFDISPKVEKWLGIKPREAATSISAKPEIDSVQNPHRIPLNGFYDEKHVLPAKIISTQSELANIDKIAADMLSNGLMTADYAGLNDRQLAGYLKQSRQPVYAICAGALVPHFRLQFEHGQYVAFAGVNEANLLRIGIIERVGLQSARTLNPDAVKLFAASVIMVGGDFKLNGRSGAVEQHQPYRIRMRVAFRD